MGRIPGAMKVLILVGDYVEDLQVMVPYQFLLTLGYTVHTCCPGKRCSDMCYTAVHDPHSAGPAGSGTTGVAGHGETYVERRGHTFVLNATFSSVREDLDSYGGLILPGGRAPEYMSIRDDVLEVVRHFVFSGKPVGCIGRGLLLLAAADALWGRRVTGDPSLKFIAELGGAIWETPSKKMKCVVDDADETRTQAFDNDEDEPQQQHQPQQHQQGITQHNTPLRQRTISGEQIRAGGAAAAASARRGGSGSNNNFAHLHQNQQMQAGLPSLLSNSGREDEGGFLHGDEMSDIGEDLGSILSCPSSAELDAFCATFVKIIGARVYHSPRRILMLVSDAVEDYEAHVPLYVLQALNVQVYCVSPGKLAGERCMTTIVDFEQELQAQTYSEKLGHSFRLNASFERDTEDLDKYDGLLLPGGRAAELLAQNHDVVGIVRAFRVASKPIAAIDHGQLLLVAADILDGLRCTAFPTLKRIIDMAGGLWLEPAPISASFAEDYANGRPLAPGDEAAIPPDSLSASANGRRSRTGSPFRLPQQPQHGSTGTLSSQASTGGHADGGAGPRALTIDLPGPIPILASSSSSNLGNVAAGAAAAGHGGSRDRSDSSPHMGGSDIMFAGPSRHHHHQHHQKSSRASPAHLQGTGEPGAGGDSPEFGVHAIHEEDDADRRADFRPCLISAAAWPAHPDFLAQMLDALAVEIIIDEPDPVSSSASECSDNDDVDALPA